MAVRRIPIAALLLGTCAAAHGQDPFPIVPGTPATCLAQLPGSAVVADPFPATLPPLLPVPPPALAPRKPCLPCHNEYQPGHVYLPDQSPDCGAGGCDGECRPCRRWWVSAELFIGWSQDLGEFDRELALGVKAGGGYWFDDSKTLGLDLSVLNVHQPYHEIFWANTLVNSPLTIATGDANVRMELLGFNRFRVDGLAGYRVVRLHEHVFINSLAGFAGDADARNTIHAAQVGLVGDYRYGAYFWELLGKVGIGRNSESLTLNKVQFSDSTMAVVPEFGARMGYQLGEGVYGTLGYTFLYLNNVARPGRPDADFYIHGFTIGLEARF